MIKIQTLEQALYIFKESAEIHGQTTEDGNYRLGNKHAAKILKAVAYLKSHNQIEHLRALIIHDDASVRSWAATYLLPHCEEDALAVLMKIEKNSGVVAFSAKVTVEEWKKGNLTFLRD